MIFLTCVAALLIGMFVYVVIEDQRN